MENKIESKEEVQRRRQLQEEDDSSIAATAVEIELEVLDCPICYLPLKPPVFQCAIGHVVCSSCYAMLDGRSCHTCGRATGFSRCFAVEHIVDSVKVPCANAGSECPDKTPYHGKEEHDKTCPHAEEVQRRRRLEEKDDSISSRATRWVAATAVEIELQVLECPICYQPLKPPVFQCAVGHVVCSCSCAKLAGKSCRMCGRARGFSRCFAVEHIVDSVKVPCVNAGRGCPAKTPYHGKKEHEKTCSHADAEGKAVTTTGPAPGTPGVPEQGGNRGSRGRNLVAGLVLASISIFLIPVAIPVVRGIIEHFSVSGARSCVATVATRGEASHQGYQGHTK